MKTSYCGAIHCPVSQRKHLPIDAVRLWAAVLLLTTANAHADTWLSAGMAPSSDGGGFSLSAADKTSEQFGWGLGFVFNSEMAGKDLLDYPVPHNNFTTLGTKRTGNAIGLDALWFPAGDSTWRPYLGLGVYYDQKAEVVLSNVSGWYYTQNDKSALQLGGEVGMQYRTTRGSRLGFGYHTIRGAFLSYGW